MIHYSCDRCNCVIDPQDDVRYAVNLESRAVMDCIDGLQAEDDQDHLLEIHEILERGDDLENEMIGEEIYQRKRFDLCGDCFRKFMSDPIGARSNKQLNFSSN